MNKKLRAATAAALALATTGLGTGAVFAEIRIPGGGGGGAHGFAPHFGGGRGFSAPHFSGFGGRAPVLHSFAPPVTHLTHSFGSPAVRSFAPHFGGAGIGGMGHFANGVPPSGVISRRYDAPVSNDAPGAIGPVAAGRMPNAFRHGWFNQRDFHRENIGWAGPVFWPYAYDELLDASFSPYDASGANADEFWAYGYSDLFAGVLLPTDNAAVHSTGGAPSFQQPMTVPASSEGQSCESAQPIADILPIASINRSLHLNADQSKKLETLQDAEANAAKTLKASCGTQTPATPLARLDAVQARLQDMIQAADVVSGPLDNFYASLTDEQKASFNAIGQTPAGPENLTRLCGPQNAVPVVAVDRIDKAVQPDAQQRADIAALSDVANKADQTILATCPQQAPLTPPGRLNAIRSRLQAMLSGVEGVRPALQRLWASLDKDQQSRFSAMGPQVAPGQTTANAPH